MEKSVIFPKPELKVLASREIPMAFMPVLHKLNTKIIDKTVCSIWYYTTWFILLTALSKNGLFGVGNGNVSCFPIHYIFLMLHIKIQRIVLSLPLTKPLTGSSFLKQCRHENRSVDISRTDVT